MCVCLSVPVPDITVCLTGQWLPVSQRHAAAGSVGTGRLSQLDLTGVCLCTKRCSLSFMDVNENSSTDLSGSHVVDGQTKAAMSVNWYSLVVIFLQDEQGYVEVTNTYLRLCDADVKISFLFFFTTCEGGVYTEVEMSISLFCLHVCTKVFVLLSQLLLGWQVRLLTILSFTK